MTGIIPLQMKVPFSIHRRTRCQNKSQGYGQFLMVNSNCVRPDGQCELCDSWDENAQVCLQDEDFGGTGHGDESLSDADPGL
jgi:hypothetical protein